MIMENGKWKIMLRIHIKCISAKSFIETRTHYYAPKK